MCAQRDDRATTDPSLRRNSARRPSAYGTPITPPIGTSVLSATANQFWCGSTGSAVAGDAASSIVTSVTVSPLSGQRTVLVTRLLEQATIAQLYSIYTSEH